MSLVDVKNLMGQGYHAFGVLKISNSDFHAVLVKRISVYSDGGTRILTNDPKFGPNWQYSIGSVNDLHKVIGLNFYIRSR